MLGAPTAENELVHFVLRRVLYGPVLEQGCILLPKNIPKVVKGVYLQDTAVYQVHNFLFVRVVRCGRRMETQFIVL